MTPAGVAYKTGDAALAASPWRKLRIGTQVKFDSKSLIDHQQSMYVVFKVQTLNKYLSIPP